MPSLDAMLEESARTYVGSNLMTSPARMCVRFRSTNFARIAPVDACGYALRCHVSTGLLVSRGVLCVSTLELDVSWKGEKVGGEYVYCTVV